MDQGGKNLKILSNISMYVIFDFDGLDFHSRVEISKKHSVVHYPTIMYKYSWLNERKT